MAQGAKKKGPALTPTRGCECGTKITRDAYSPHTYICASEFAIANRICWPPWETHTAFISTYTQNKSLEKHGDKMGQNVRVWGGVVMV